MNKIGGAIDSIYKYAAIVTFLCVPMALWKYIEIFIYVWENIS